MRPENLPQLPGTAYVRPALFSLGPCRCAQGPGCPGSTAGSSTGSSTGSAARSAAGCATELRPSMRACHIQHETDAFAGWQRHVANASEMAVHCKLGVPLHYVQAINAWPDARKLAFSFSPAGKRFALNILRSQHCQRCVHSGVKLIAMRNWIKGGSKRSQLSERGRAG